MKRNKYSIWELILKWNSPDYIWHFTIDVGYSRFEFFRSSIYSVSTSLVILFLSKADSLNWVSWLSLAVAVWFALIAANKFTVIALILKEQQDNWSKAAGCKLTLQEFVMNGTVDSKSRMAAYFKKGVIAAFSALMVVFSAFFINKYLKTDSANQELTNHIRCCSIKDSLSFRETWILNTRIDSLAAQMQRINNCIDSLRNIKCR